VTTGDALPPRTFGPITRTDIVRYQGASGDFNPIHHDEEFAREAGLPTVLSVGMLQAGLLATYCVDLLGAENVREFAVRFRERVWPGDLLRCSGSVTAIEDDPGGEGRRVAIDLAMVRVGDDSLVLSGRAVFSSP
jgi:acyl dehydratase